MPTFLFIRNGEVLDQFSGANAAVLRQKLEGLLETGEEGGSSVADEANGLEGEEVDSDIEADFKRGGAATEGGTDGGQVEKEEDTNGIAGDSSREPEE